MTMVETRPITGGVDTHLDVHVAAALDGIGGLLGVESFATTAAGYGELTDWLCRFGSVVRVGIEGTGSYGAGLARYLHGAGIAVVEVNRADRQARRRQGKSDPLEPSARRGRRSPVAPAADRRDATGWWKRSARSWSPVARRVGTALPLSTRCAPWLPPLS
jgi:hypothetical protein